MINLILNLIVQKYNILIINNGFVATVKDSEGMITLDTTIEKRLTC